MDIRELKTMDAPPLTALAIRFVISGANPAARRMLLTHGVKAPLVEFATTIDNARTLLKAERA